MKETSAPEPARDPDSDTAGVSSGSALGLLAGTIAHEINNPLMGLMGFAQLLEDRLSGEELKYLRSVLEQAERIRVIGVELLAFSRQSGTVAKSVRLGALMDEVEEAAGRLLATRPVRLEVECHLASERLVCHVQLLRQLLMILITRAAAVYSGLPSAAPGVIRLRSHEVSTPNRRAVRLSVELVGERVPLSILRAAEEPFYRLRAPFLEEQLELAVAQRIAQRHGARIQVAAHEENITEWSLELPVGEDD